MQPPSLTTTDRTGRILTLRPHRPDDVDPVLAMVTDPWTASWLDALPEPYHREHAEWFVGSRAGQWRSEGPGVEWSLAIEVDGQFVGQVGVRPQGSVAEVAYVMDLRHVGRGIMTAALREFGRWALDPAGADLQSLVWRARRGNWASRRVAWACGYRFGGLVLGMEAKGATPVDLWLASRQRGDQPYPVLPWYQPPRIDVGSLVLRAPRDEDLPRIQQACADPETSTRLPQLPQPYTVDHAQAYLEAIREEMATGRSLVWTVADADEPATLLAMVALDKIALGGSPSCEVGYWVHPDARRRSVATVACRVASRHALLPASEGGLGLNAVLLRAGVGNEGSLRVARAAGFTRTGTDPEQERFRDGSLGDLARFHFTLAELEAAWAHPSSLI